MGAGFYAPGEKIEAGETITTGYVKLHQLLSENPYCLSHVGAKADGFTVVDVVEGDDNRWTRIDQMVVEYGEGEFYSFDYEVGLTEYQQCEPFEYSGIAISRVEKRVKVVESATWVPVDK